MGHNDLIRVIRRAMTRMEAPLNPVSGCLADHLPLRLPTLFTLPLSNKKSHRLLLPSGELRHLSVSNISPIFSHDLIYYAKLFTLYSIGRMRKNPNSLIAPAQAGVQEELKRLDS